MTTGPEAGYYADPSIPGYIRYWDGTQWVEGTSRPAPDELLQQQVQHQWAQQEPVQQHEPVQQQLAVMEQTAAGVITDVVVGTGFEGPGIDHAGFGDAGIEDAGVETAAEPEPSVANMVVPSAFGTRGTYGSGWASAANGSPFDAIPGLYRGLDADENAAREPEARVVELASAGSRTLARIIDTGIAVLLSAPVTVTLVLLAHRHDHAYVNGLRLRATTTYRTLGMDATGIALWACAVGVVILTAIVFEMYRLPRSGQTTGRRLVGVQVVATETADDVSGAAAGTRALLFWLLAIIPVLNVLALGGVLWGRPYRQGLHERLSGTLSIRA